jgi:NADPH:quinone reductase-like Zn-dependent oxidoreductase
VSYRRRVVVESFGDPDVMRISADEVPHPGAGEVRVRVLAAGVAHADILMRAGRYPGGNPRPPFVPGWDIAGVVEALGPGVPDRWHGERIAALVFSGGYASHVCLPADNLVSLPAGVDVHEAACLPLNYVTAYELLRHVAQARPADRILVHGAAGGVGSALLDLASRIGLDAYGTASSRKGSVVTSFGAHFIDYTAEDFETCVLAATGDGVDAIFDPIGAANLPRSFRTLREGGRLISYGFLDLRWSRFHTLPVLRDLLRLRIWSLLPNGRQTAFYRLSDVARCKPQRIRDNLDSLVSGLQSGNLRPLIAELMPLDRAADAHRLIEHGNVQGKILLVP